MSINVSLKFKKLFKLKMDIETKTFKVVQKMKNIQYLYLQLIVFVSKINKKLQHTL